LQTIRLRKVDLDKNARLKRMRRGKEAAAAG